MRIVHLAPSVSCLSLLMAACAGPTQKPEAQAPEPESSDAASKSSTASCSELAPASDGLIEDFEDGDGQVSALAGRNGYWWTASDDRGSKITYPSGPFLPDSGAGDAGHAAHVAGTTVAAQGAWGAEFGANLLMDKGALYDASKYAGFRFRAKAGQGPVEMKVGLSDANTHQDAGVCKQCWNHFRKDISLAEDWAVYTVRFADLQQRPGWGDPRPPAVDASQVVGLSFAVDGGQSFDVWVDDLEFLACP